MICPVCGGAEMVPNSRRLMPFHWHGRETMLECEGDLCPMCGEILLTAESSTSLDKQLRDFKSAAKEDFAGYVRFIRRKLGLSQKDAGELFGGGVNAFSRYELGKASPPLSLLVLFRLLETHPGLLEEIRQRAPA